MKRTPLVMVLSIVTSFAAAACTATAPDGTDTRRAPLDGYETPPADPGGGAPSNGGGDDNGGGGGNGGGSADHGGDNGGGGGGGGTAGGGAAAALDLSADLDVCGHVDAFTAAAGGACGALSIAGCDVPIGGATSLVGEALLHVGGAACVHAHVDASGAIDHGSVSTNLLGAAHAKVCGTVHAYVAASAAAGGHVQVGAPKLRLAAGAQVSGSAALAIGASVCVEGSLNLAGELTACVVSAH